MQIDVTVEKIGRSSVQVRYEGSVDGRPVFRARNTAVVVDMATFKSTALPDWLRARFEAGHAALLETERELAEVVSSARERAREADLLRFGLGEIELAIIEVYERREAIKAGRLHDQAADIQCACSRDCGHPVRVSAFSEAVPGPLACAGVQDGIHIV